jgi:hypothetical protein
LTDPANPPSTYAEALASLRADDLITVVERLRHSTFELLDWLPEGVDGEQAESGFPLLRGRLEQCLAIAQPLLDFAGERGVEEICWMLQTLASEQGDSSNLQGEPMISLALHDLGWTLIADCLARDRLEPLPRLAGVAIPDPYENRATPVLRVSGIRHTNAFEREADSTYRSWRDWLAASDLLAAMSHFGEGSRLTSSLAEAELIAALCFSSEHGERSFCASLGEGAGERRLRAHFRNPPAASALAQLFEVEVRGLAERMNELYAQLAGPDRFGPHTTLIAT